MKKRSNVKKRVSLPNGGYYLLALPFEKDEGKNKKESTE